MPELFLTVCAVSGVALIYLVLDVYPTVKSFRATISTFSFWLFWIFFSLLSVIAFSALKFTGAEKLRSRLDPGIAELAIILFAVIGTVGILQSLTLRLGDNKLIDLGKFVESFRRQVLADISAVAAEQKSHRALRVADKIYARYKDGRGALRDAYAGVMSFGNRSIAQIGKELDDLEQEAKGANLSFELILARRIAQADIMRAEELMNTQPRLNAAK